MVDILRVKRRAVGGAAGGPAIGTIAAAEIAFNEQDNTLYYGKGNNAGLATSVIAIAGPGAFAPLASPVFTGDPKSSATLLVTDNDTSLATTAFVQSVVSSNGVQTYNGRSGAVVPILADITAAGGAPLASPAFSGNPTAPTVVLTDSSTAVATTAFVKGQLYATAASLPLASITNPLPDGAVAIGSATTRYALADHVHPTDSTRAPLASPTFTGNVTLPTGTIGVTQAVGDEDTSMATTAFAARVAGGFLSTALADADATWTPTQMGIRIVNVTGTLTADRTITIPVTGQQRDWVVRNGTGGGFNVNFTTGTSTYSIPPAFTGEFWTNGSALFASQSLLLSTTVHIGDATRNALVVTTGLTTTATTISTTGTGALTFGQGVAFGSALAPGGNTDLSRHIALYSTTYGFSVTSSRLNYLTGSAHVFLAGGSDRVTINTGGLTMTTGNPITLPDLPTVGTSAANKNYVDAHVSPVLATIALLRAATATTLTAPQCTVQSYSTLLGKGGGIFLLMSSDTTSADNGGTIIVDASSRRWYRDYGEGQAFAVAWFGAIGNNIADDTAPIQAAINACGAAGGGIVKFDALNYRITATLNLGNGTSSAVSTYGSIRLEGVGPTWFPPSFYGGYPVTNATIIIWRGVSTGTIIQVNGPLQGWGVANMVLDGTPSGGGFGVGAANGLKVISAQNGYSPGLLIRGCTFGLYSTTVAPFGTATITDSLRNHYPDMAIGMGWTNGAAAVVLTGLATSNTDYNTFENLTVALPTSLGTGQAAYGVYLQSCDSNVFIAPHFFNGDPNFPAFFLDYTINPDWPSGNVVIHPDWGNILAPFETTGTPTANSAPTMVTDVNQVNGGVYPHDVSNISWAMGVVCTYRVVGQNAEIATHPIYHTREGGLYQFNYYLLVTGGTISGGTISTSIGWLDGSGSNSITSINVPNGPGNYGHGVHTVVLGAGGPINVLTTFNAIGGTTEYELWVTVERLA